MTLSKPAKQALALKTLTAMCFAILLVGFLAPPSLAGRIKDLHQSLTLGRSGQLLVEETITADFGKAGPAYFYRRIPTIYKRNGKVSTLNIYVQGVDDGQGREQSYTSKDMHGYENIVIGDGRQALSGVHVYKLKYDLINSVNYSSGRPELFYSVLGREWSTPIDKVTATVSLSPAQGALAARAAGYVGSFGSKRRARTKYGGNMLEVAGGPFAPGQDLVLSLPLPAGAVTMPGWSEALDEIYQTSPVAVLFPTATLGMLVLLWLLIGSDAHFGKVPKFDLGAPWQPPRELTPAEIGTLIDESCDDRDLVATVFDLACRGYLQIRETPNHGLVGYGNKDYEFSQPPQPVKGELKPHEQLILNALFTGRNKSYLTDMQGYLFDYMPILRKQVFGTLAKGKFFARNPQDDRTYFINLGSLVLACGAALFAYSMVATDTYRFLSLGVIISGAMIFLASGVMPKRSRKGVAAIDQTHKFQHFIMHGSEQEIADALRSDPTIFERLLPYAMVVDMAEFWAARFRRLIKECPPWYISMEEETGSAGQFNTEILVKEILAAMNAIGHTVTTRPVQKAGKRQKFTITSDLP